MAIDLYNLELNLAIPETSAARSSGEHAPTANDHLATDPSTAIYRKSYEFLKRSGALSIDDSVLIVCGGELDFRCARDAGLIHVTLSNLADQADDLNYRQYSWSRQDVENLSYADGSFDFVVESRGLHHCASPHRGLLEMYRVARKGVLIIENYDGLLVKAAKLLNLTSDYEMEEVVGSGYISGGWRNSFIPNFVYRWTEAEIRKTVCSYDPAYAPRLKFTYGKRLPIRRVSLQRTGIRSVLKMLLLRTAGFVMGIVPLKGNLMAVMIDKRPAGRRRMPWLAESEGHLRLNQEWFDDRFGGNSAKLEQDSEDRS